MGYFVAVLINIQKMLKESRFSLLLTFATDSSVMHRPKHQPVHCACFLQRVCSVSALRTSLPAMCLLCSFNPVIHVQPITCLQFWPPAHHYYWEPLIALDIHLPIKSSMLPIKEVLSESRDGAGCRGEPGFIISFVTVGGALTKDTGCSYQTHVMGAAVAVLS